MLRKLIPNWRCKYNSPIAALPRMLPQWQWRLHRCIHTILIGVSSASRIMTVEKMIGWLIDDIVVVNTITIARTKFAYRSDSPAGQLANMLRMAKIKRKLRHGRVQYVLTITELERILRKIYQYILKQQSNWEAWRTKSYYRRFYGRPSMVAKLERIVQRLCNELQICEQLF